MPSPHFLIFIAVSLAVFIGILRWVLRARSLAPPAGTVIVVALVVVVVGMCFAKFGAKVGLAVPIYYGVPAAITLLLPPLVFSMNLREASWYFALAFLSSPAIHVFFSVFIGWHEYLPFWHIPSLLDA
jgi:CDP-diglyceride synthetase